MPLNLNHQIQSLPFGSSQTASNHLTTDSEGRFDEITVWLGRCLTNLGYIGPGERYATPLSMSHHGLNLPFLASESAR
jgi:hypothetical protein